MRRRRGSNAVEFALILPVLVLLLTGIIDTSWYLGERITLIHAAREGARAGALTPQDERPEAAVERAVAASLEAAGIRGRVYLTVDVEGQAPDQTIAVAVGVPYEGLTGFIPMPELISASIVMRMEDQPG